MSIVKMSVVEVPVDARDELERRFSERAGTVANAPGFEGFQLLRPIDGENRYYVVTWWSTEQAFEDWMMTRREVKARRVADGTAKPHISTDNVVLSFELVEKIEAP